MIKIGALIIFLLAIILVAIASRPQLSIVDSYRGSQDYWPKPTIDVGVDFKPLGALPKEARFPEHNPYSKAKETLGRQLFFDRRMSQSEQVSCASCHDPDLGWADGKRKAIGHDRLRHDLNTPSIINSAWLDSIYWNGRAGSLEAQIIETWQNPVEMAAHIPSAVARIASIKGYVPMFQDAFGTEDVSAMLISRAIATFMRQVTLTNTKFDKFMRGERATLKDAEIEGLHLFRTKARCINCHSGSLLSDGKFHHLGSSFHNVGEFQGRYRVTKHAEDVGAFRTPGLRGIAETSPYLHNGLIKDVDTLLFLYSSGWWQNGELDKKDHNIPTATRSSHIKNLDLNGQERMHLKAFLGTLEGQVYWVKPPPELR
jgi:cytochrome c peroxidase